MTDDAAGSGLSAFHATPTLLNSSAAPLPSIALRECTTFFGTNASHPYPGAEVLLHGCHMLNSLPISEALSIMEGARHGRVKGKPYPNALGSVPSRYATPRGHVVVMGDSHAKDWVVPFSIVGKRLGFTVTNLGKSSCPPTLTLLNIANGRDAGVRAYSECQEWIANGVDTIVQERPLAVVFVAYHNYSPADEKANVTAVAAGVVQVAKRIIAADIPVLYIKSTPVMPISVPDCLAKEVARKPGSADLSACSVSKKQGLFRTPVETAARMYPLMRQLSFDDALCVNEACPPIIGNVVVYQDKHHLTRAFAQSLAPVLEEKLFDVAPFFERFLDLGAGEKFA